MFKWYIEVVKGQIQLVWSPPVHNSEWHVGPMVFANSGRNVALIIRSTIIENNKIYNDKYVLQYLHLTFSNNFPWKKKHHIQLLLVLQKSDHQSIPTQTQKPGLTLNPQINLSVASAYSNKLPYEYMLALSDEATSWQPFVRPDPWLS